MARYTAAYSSFLGRLQEVDVLNRLASHKERSDPVLLRREINAICRSAVVLLSSHLEAYIKELGALALNSLHANGVPLKNLSTQFFYYVSKSQIDELKDTEDHERLAIKIFNFLQTEAPYWTRTGVLPQAIPHEQFNGGFSNPKHPKTCAYFNRFGYSNFNRDIARQLRAQHAPVINMVDHLVDTRNKIAHGDHGIFKTPGDIRVMTGLVRTYCQVTDAAFAGWWKQQFCSIR